MTEDSRDPMRRRTLAVLLLTAAAAGASGCSTLPPSRWRAARDLDVVAVYALNGSERVVEVPASSADLSVLSFETLLEPGGTRGMGGGREVVVERFVDRGRRRQLVIPPGSGAVEVRARLRVRSPASTSATELFPGADRVETLAERAWTGPGDHRP